MPKWPILGAETQWCPDNYIYLAEPPPFSAGAEPMQLKALKCPR